MAAVAVAATGCAGPEKKLGRGLSNVSEITRLGEFRRSVEQTALFNGPEAAYSTGFLRGINRTLTRTGIGIYEIVTFPLPSYEPTMKPYATGKYSVNPQYPDSFKPGLIEDTTFSPDTSLGFGGGDVMPFIPGSRFRVFDN